MVIYTIRSRVTDRVSFRVRVMVRVGFRISDTVLVRVSVLIRVIKQGFFTWQTVRSSKHIQKKKYYTSVNS